MEKSQRFQRGEQLIPTIKTQIAALHRQKEAALHDGEKQNLRDEISRLTKDLAELEAGGQLLRERQGLVEIFITTRELAKGDTTIKVTIPNGDTPKTVVFEDTGSVLLKDANGDTLEVIVQSNEDVPLSGPKMEMVLAGIQNWEHVEVSIIEKEQEE